MALPNDCYATARDEFLGTVVEDLDRHSRVSIRLPGWSGPASKTNGRPDFSCGHQICYAHALGQAAVSRPTTKRL